MYTLKGGYKLKLTALYCSSDKTAHQTARPNTSPQPTEFFFFF
jgi:hypothetical protein